MTLLPAPTKTDPQVTDDVRHILTWLATGLTLVAVICVAKVLTLAATDGNRASMFINTVTAAWFGYSAAQTNKRAARYRR